MRPVEVVSAVRYTGVVPVAEVGCVASSSHVLSPGSGHVVDNSVYVDPRKKNRIVINSPLVLLFEIICQDEGNVVRADHQHVRWSDRIVRVARAERMT